MLQSVIAPSSSNIRPAGITHPGTPVIATSSPAAAVGPGDGVEVAADVGVGDWVVPAVEDWPGDGETPPIGEKFAVGEETGEKSGVGERSELEGVALGVAGPCPRSLKSAAVARPIRTTIKPRTPTRRFNFFKLPLYENQFSKGKCSRLNYINVVICALEPNCWTSGARYGAGDEN